MVANDRVEIRMIIVRTLGNCSEFRLKVRKNDEDDQRNVWKRNSMDSL
jgi:hypothetical protein